MSRTFLILGGLLGTLAVAAGAFGSHLLKARLSTEFFAIFEVAARYHMYHSLALLGTAVLGFQFPQEKFLRLAGILFLLGILFFSGSLKCKSFKIIVVCVVFISFIKKRNCFFFVSLH